MYEIRWSTRFARDIKRCRKRGKTMRKFKEINEQLIAGISLSPKNRDHLLTGNWDGCRECHIEPDWLLIYKIDEDAKTLEYMRTGTHADLFG